ncbi:MULTISPECIES: type II secretion system ATPase GspE [unclassified Sphingomonas]|uniref:type II secretion system ATPase GspE n=1 Tax=unclassified Sphingomonas TaxID=196159 RepID=UPI0006FEDC5F|nr:MULTISPECIES: type II secretion system ATPase GspE [unclassified Sphingomonas]KQX21660.1 type II secretion system protein GspE [Sphingomonas sp. Root1294]KQY72976.1 type II secretion system protein GspE [Sphingomonas sp. Root50]KRB88229.1 type II secretion system protein GspE [Sphingomonas sp. Root720]
MTALPYSFARRHGVLLQDGTEGAVRCLFRTGATPEAMLEVQRRFGSGLAFETVADEAFESAVAAAYRDSGGAMDLTDTDDLATLADSAAAVDDLLDSRDDSPVIRLINALLLQSVRDGASDIHVETQEKRLIVRFRVDGVLRDVVEPKRALAPLLVSRIKVMARLDIAEKRIPQDGRVTLRVGGYDIDVRVSTIPTQHGERVVMRLLDRGSAGLDTATLGMSERDRDMFLRLLDRPHGILLVTGPTGSGKTTTLYTALTHLNDRKRNIMTVEDPIEYELAGIAQTQVNAKTGMSFARGLRAILRQDPDVIMVGEIRDQETAEVAVRSSMTGHFVLSTLHTNSAIGSITRLTDMGVERYLLAPMVVGLIAQRLVRRLCEHCRWQDRATDADSALLGGALKPGKKIWRAGGCDECHGEGYKGRMALYEVVAADDELRRMIHDGASEAQLTAAARKAGPSLLDDGIAKLRAGLTTVEEVARVVQDEG